MRSITRRKLRLPMRDAHLISIVILCVLFGNPVEVDEWDTHKCIAKGGTIALDGDLYLFSDQAEHHAKGIAPIVHDCAIHGEKSISDFDVRPFDGAIRDDLNDPQIIREHHTNGSRSFYFNVSSRVHLFQAFILDGVSAADAYQPITVCLAANELAA